MLKTTKEDVQWYIEQFLQRSPALKECTDYYMPIKEFGEWLAEIGALKKPIGPETVEEAKEEYIHARKYITKDALEKADEQTKKTWEFEAELCDKVIEVMGGESCPWCASRTFAMGDIIVDFRYPFVDGYRIRVLGLPVVKLPVRPTHSPWVRCTVCSLSRKLVKIPVNGLTATVTKTIPPTQKLVAAECPKCGQAPCIHTAETISEIQKEEP